MRKIIFKDGTSREITGEEGKFWLTGEARVRKLSDAIAEIAETAEAEEQPKAEAPKKKPAKKKKKTEDAEDGDCGG